MEFVYFLVALLVVLLIYTMLSTIIKLSLYITTGISYEHSRLLIPVILSNLIWLLVGSLCILTLFRYTNSNIFFEFFDIYLKKESLLPLLKTISKCSTIYLIIGTLLQSLTYFAVNIKLENLFSSIRYGLKRLFKIGRKKEHKGLTLFYQIPGLSIFRAFFTSFLTTVMMLIAIIGLFTIGIFFSNNINF